MLPPIRWLREHPRSTAAINAALIVAAIAGNSYYQVFCRPVPWAATLLMVCALNAVAYPWLFRRRVSAALSAFVSGVALFVCAYCIVFLGPVVNVFGVLAIAYFGLGLLVYVPHLIGLQLAATLVAHRSQREVVVASLLALAVCGAATLHAAVKYKRVAGQVRSAVQNNDPSDLQTDYLTERVLGIGILYHTEFCAFDGWRPPLHDPYLDVGLMLSGYSYPFPPFATRRRVVLYRSLFPDRPVRLDCGCARQYEEWYLSDPVLR